jgi:hypothetical protein
LTVSLSLCLSAWLGAPKSTPTTARPVLHVQRKHCASTAQASCPPVCQSVVPAIPGTWNADSTLSQPSPPTTQQPVCVAQPCSPPASPVWIRLDARCPSSPWPCPPIASSQTSTYRIVANLDPSHRRKPNTPTHPLTLLNPTPMPTPLSQRARAPTCRRVSASPSGRCTRTGQEPAQTRTGTPCSLSSLCTRSARLGPLVSRPLRSRQGCCAWTLAERRRRIGPWRSLLCDAIGRVGSVV